MDFGDVLKESRIQATHGNLNITTVVFICIQWLKMGEKHIIYGVLYLAQAKNLLVLLV